VGDDPETVIKNRSIIASGLNIPLPHFVIPNQVHGCKVAIVTDQLKGSGVFDHVSALKETDAMITNIPNICLMLLQADCVPIVLFDVRKKVIGVAHAGWRGTVSRIAQNTIKALCEKFGCLPENILAGIGPSIGPCCYEVGYDTIVQFENAFCTEKGFIYNKMSDGKGYLDLWDANKVQIMQTGIPEMNIEVAGLCTNCNHDLFFSYRYQKGDTGRFGMGIMLKGGSL
jgi:YfiH family protein